MENIIDFNPPLVPAVFIRRYQRFLADVRLASGEEVTIHVPNTGSMQSCLEPGWPVLLSPADNPARRTRFTLEMGHNGCTWIGLNTQRANSLVMEAWREGIISEWTEFNNIQSEVKVGKHTRLDMLLSNEHKKCYVEIKTVTLLVNGHFQFPDAVTTRGARHLKELAGLRQRGYESTIFFLVLREDGDYFEPAAHIDSEYAVLLADVKRQDVQILAYGATVRPQGIRLVDPIHTKV